MDRKKILTLKQNELLDIVNKRFDITISGLEDAKNLSDAWKIVERLEKKGWRFDIISAKALKQVDGLRLENGNPVTIFAQYGYSPHFESITEGICKTALIALNIMERATA
ncbi:MAG: hypothetical protein U9R23_05105 [Candidatus Cloacimonadota bacterium]|nr:hypothetical protein [Candidatus Cloacimonadota bacterium]